MNTINISLPEKLKSQAEVLVKDGYYASFSDLVRDAIRQKLEAFRYARWTKEAKEDAENGKAAVLRSGDDITAYMKNIK